MNIQRKYGIEWRLSPQDPHEVQEFFNRAADIPIPLFDHFDQMLIYSSRHDAESVLSCLVEDGRRADVEPCELLMVPGGTAVTPSDRFEDFAFSSSRGHVYFDLAYTDVFRLIANKPEAEPAPAMMQLEEHRIAAIAAAASGDATDWQVIERQLAELANRVARAYHCGIEWLDIDHLQR